MGPGFYPTRLDWTCRLYPLDRGRKKRGQGGYGFVAGGAGGAVLEEGIEPAMGLRLTLNM